ncbi:uncharacterized protein LOC130630648 [Hydractinia symbiolongicarpus]|uniref:uncharacterized protein LOC130630648 n=1 Tax=Hydractinia symbiolongicarpus TaxID=13093 RepID=UPI00254B1AF2|nr:uncharacterized protein LOC130630648 [Hydractinia symbiolongicarpus]
MGEKRLGNLTFSFRNAMRNSSVTSPKEDIITVSPENPNKKIIADENNLQNLFTRARSTEHIERLGNETENQIKYSTEPMQDDVSEHLFVNHIGLYWDEQRINSSQETLLLDTISNKSHEEVNTFNSRHRNDETRPANLNAKSLAGLTFNESQNGGERTAWMPKHHSVEEFQNEPRRRKSEGWIPKSAAAKAYLSKNSFDIRSMSNISKEQQREDQFLGQYGSERFPKNQTNVDKGDIMVIDDWMNTKIENNNFNKNPIQDESIENDKMEVLPWDPLEGKSHQILTNSSYDALIFNEKDIVEEHSERVINISNSEVDDILSFDVRSEKEFKLKNKHPKHFQKKSQSEYFNMSQNCENGLANERENRTNSWLEYNHQLAVSSPIETKIKKLNMNENRLIHTTQLYGNNIKKQKHEKETLQKKILIKNNKVLADMNSIETDPIFEHNIKKISSMDYSAYDDGYGSGSNRTNHSSASETPTTNRSNNDLIISLTDQVNFTSQDSGDNNGYAKITRSLSNLHELLNEEDERETQRRSSREEENEKRNGIHNKLENILKAKAKTLERSKNPHQATTQYKFPDPLLAERTKSLPNGLNTQNYNYTSSNTYDNVDEESFRAHSKQADASYHQGRSSSIEQSETPSSRYGQRHLSLIKGDSIHVEKKETLLNELRSTIKSRSPRPDDRMEMESFNLTNYDKGTQGSDYAFRNQSLLGESNESNSWDQAPDTENLFEMFPLQPSPTRHITLGDDPFSTLNNMSADSQAQSPEIYTDQRPINKSEVMAMLKSHLKDKTGLDSLKREEKSYRMIRPKMKSFSFTSLDADVENKPSVSELPTTNLESNQRRLSLESVNTEYGLSTSIGSDNPSNRIGASHAHRLSLTESELEGVRTYPHKVANPTNKDLPSFHDDKNGRNEFKSKEPIIAKQNASTSNQQVTKDVASVETIVLSRTPANPVQIFSDHETLEQVPKQSPINTQSVKSRHFNGSYEEMKRSNSFNEANVNVDVSNRRQQQQQQPQKEEDTRTFYTRKEVPATQVNDNKNNAITHYYLPEHNQERVIKPSEYQVHKFSDRTKYQSPQSQQTQRNHMSVTLDTSNIKDFKTSNLHNKRQSPRKQKAKQIKNHIEVAPVEQNVVSNELNGEQLEAMDVEVKDYTLEGTNAIPEYLPKTPNEKWADQTYTHTNVGKINIPSSFLPNDSVIFSTSSTTPSISPRPSTPKKSRKVSSSSNKQELSRPSTPSKIGSKLRMLFSPSSKRKLQKRDSNETLSTQLFASPRSDEDITRRKNINVTSWSYDDVISINGSNHFDEDDDSIDVDFITNDEWLTSQTKNINNEYNHSANPNSATRNGSAPKIKAPLLPNSHNTKHSLKNNTKYGIGKIVVPDVFSSNEGNNMTPLTFNTRYVRAPPKQKQEEEKETVIDLEKNEIAFNSLDIRSIGYKAGRRLKHQYQPAVSNHISK